MYVKVFHGLKTLEYDLALHADNRTSMLKALKELHPGIGKTVEAVVESASGDAAKAHVLFSGMFERPQQRPKRPVWAGSCASLFGPRKSVCKSDYIRNAIEHACQDKAPKA